MRRFQGRIGGVPSPLSDNLPPDRGVRRVSSGRLLAE